VWSEPRLYNENVFAAKKVLGERTEIGSTESKTRSHLGKEFRIQFSWR
jgi:hypothetical protein